MGSKDNLFQIQRNTNKHREDQDNSKNPPTKMD